MESETRIVYLLQKEVHVSRYGYYTVGIAKNLAVVLDTYGHNSAVISCRTIKEFDEVLNVLLTTFKFFFRAVDEDVGTFEGDIQALYYKFEEITNQKVYISKFIPALTVPTEEIPNILDDVSILSVVDSIKKVDPTICPKCDRKFSTSRGVKQHLLHQKLNCAGKKTASPNIPKI